MLVIEMNDNEFWKQFGLYEGLVKLALINALKKVIE